MNEEIKEAINHFEEAIEAKKGAIKFDYTIASKDVELLLNYITNLQQRVEQLEKENKELKRNCNIGNENLTFYRNQCKQLENIRKEAIEYIKSFENSPEYIGAYDITYWQDEVLHILNKGSDKDVN